MRKRIKSILLIAIVAISMMVVFSGSVRAVQLPRLYVWPSEVKYETDVECEFNNTEFTVEVKIANVTDCYGVDFWLQYNSTLLEKVGMVDIHGPFDSGNPPIRPDPATYPGGYMLTDLSHLPPSGWVRISLTFVGAVGAPSFNGTGTVAAITFKIIYCPEQIVGDPQQNNTVWSDLAFDETKVKIYNPAGGAQDRLPSLDGYYEYTTIGRVPPKPISIYTDKYSYSAGDTMDLGLGVTNPLDRAITVCIAIWLERPVGPIILILHAHAVTLPAGFTYSNPTFESFVLPSIPPGVYTWHAAFLNPLTHKILVEDTAQWQFS